jgi:hypothetical protein
VENCIICQQPTPARSGTCPNCEPQYSRVSCPMCGLAMKLKGKVPALLKCMRCKEPLRVPSPCDEGSVQTQNKASQGPDVSGSERWPFIRYLVCAVLALSVVIAVLAMPYLSTKTNKIQQQPSIETASKPSLPPPRVLKSPGEDEAMEQIRNSVKVLLASDQATRKVLKDREDQAFRTISQSQPGDQNIIALALRLEVMNDTKIRKNQWFQVLESRTKAIREECDRAWQRYPGSENVQAAIRSSEAELRSLNEPWPY